MADAYIAEIRMLQPEGPYLLGGYSGGGGVVAFEMARRLTAMGQQVGLLAFIDTFHPQQSMSEITVLSRLKRLRKEGMAYLREVAFERKRLTEQAAARRHRHR